MESLTIPDNGFSFSLPIFAPPRESGILQLTGGFSQRREGAKARRREGAKARRHEGAKAQRSPRKECLAKMSLLSGLGRRRALLRAQQHPIASGRATGFELLFSDLLNSQLWRFHQTVAPFPGRHNQDALAAAGFDEQRDFFG